MQDTFDCVSSDRSSHVGFQSEFKPVKENMDEIMHAIYFINDTGIPGSKDCRRLCSFRGGKVLYLLGYR
jgi:hypothetical protein